MRCTKVEIKLVIVSATLSYKIEWVDGMHGIDRRAIMEG